MARHGPRSSTSQFKLAIRQKLGFEKSPADRNAVLREKFYSVRPAGPRKRALTLPLDGDDERNSSVRSKSARKAKKQVTFEQLQSPFFTTLPLELRWLIYQFALGDQMMHMIHFEDGLGCIECFSLDEARGVEHVCWWQSWAGLPVGRSLGIPGGTPQLYGPSRFDPKRKKPARLSLLMSCRRVYSEAIDIMYSHNSFSFRRLETIFQFTNAVIPSRLKQIRTIEFSWNPRFFGSIDRPPVDQETWNSVCRLLADLPALRKLTIRLLADGVFRSPPCNLNNALPIFEPLCWITQPSEFDVEIPSLGEHPDAPFDRFEELSKGAPFRLVELPVLRLH